MGPGVESVSRSTTPDFDVVTGIWNDKRIGTFRGIRAGGKGYGGTAFGEKGVDQIGGFAGYEPLLIEVIKFFKSGDVPVDPEETLDIYAFMSAADESKRQGGKPVMIKDVMAEAEKAADARLKELLGGVSLPFEFLCVLPPWRQTFFDSVTIRLVRVIRVRSLPAPHSEGQGALR